MQLWKRLKMVTGRSERVELERHVLGFYRVVWTRTNSLPKPPSEKLYLLTCKRAEWMYHNITGWYAHTYVWHDAPPPQHELDANRENEPEGEHLRTVLTTWLEHRNIGSMYLDTQHHRVDIQIDVLPPRIKPVLTKWGSIYVVDKDRP
jgi:hypothetical protein